MLFDRKTKRYRLHELVRIFGNSLASSEEIANSEKRFGQHYLNVLARANQLYLQSGQPHSQGLEIFDHERENIRHGWTWSSSQAESDSDVAKLSWTFTLAGGNILLNRLPADELKAWCQRSISIAKQLNSREAELTPLTLLGLVHESVGEYNSAEQVFREAIVLANELEDQRGTAVVYQHLGRAQADSGKLYDAIQSYERAKQIWCDLGEHENEWKLIADIGLAYSEVRETTLAISHLQSVVDNARKEGNELDEANALANLANVYGKRSRAEAISLDEQAAQIFERLGYKHWAAQALATSGQWLVETGESAKGIQRLEESISVLHEIGDRHLEVLAVGQLGEAYMTLNEPQKAIAAFDRQLQLAREIGDKHREANALVDKGKMLAADGQMDLATIAFDEARNVAQLTGNLDHEFNTLCKAGKAYVKAGRRQEAIKAFEDQVTLGNSMGIASKALHALKHLADSFAEWEDIARAKAYMQLRVIVSQQSKDVHDYPEALFESAMFFAEIGKLEPAILQAESAVVAFDRNKDFSCARKVRDKIEEWKRAQA
ncbi:MAG TPA: tetratricopeptide repeat protein [Pyrinomonadaceae bacterium]|nr:tetratricopeptide repeat protein [Pyrinomonadaceae bacterium]